MPCLHNVIDVHSHAILPIGEGVPASNLPDWSVDLALAYMDRYGISACLLSVPDAANHALGQEGRDLARLMNETLAGFVAKHPGRFGALATVPGQDADGALREIEYALDTLGMDGIATSTSINDLYLGEPSFDPWFDEMNRRGATLFVHPTVTRTSLPLLLGMNASVLEFMFDTTRMLTNMVVTGAKKRFSDINIISTHGGGTIPFLAARVATLEHTFGVGPGRLALSAEEVREGFASFHYDLTAATTTAQLGAILDLVPPSKLLMGLDFPLMPETSVAPAFTNIGAYPGFSEADLRAISFGNAGKLFPKLKERLDRGVIPVAATTQT